MIPHGSGLLKVNAHGFSKERSVREPGRVAQRGQVARPAEDAPESPGDCKQAKWGKKEHGKDRSPDLALKRPQESKK